jgi:hypothetical protein
VFGTAGSSEGDFPVDAAAPSIESDGGGGYSTGFPGADTVDVITYVDGSPAQSPFYIAVFC